MRNSSGKTWCSARVDRSASPSSYFLAFDGSLRLLWCMTVSRRCSARVPELPRVIFSPDFFECRAAFWLAATFCLVMTVLPKWGWWWINRAPTHAAKVVPVVGAARRRGRETRAERGQSGEETLRCASRLTWRSAVISQSRRLWDLTFIPGDVDIPCGTFRGLLSAPPPKHIH